MAVSRNREGGKALMALSIDSPAPPELLARLREGVDDAYVIVARARRSHRAWPEPVERVVVRAARRGGRRARRGVHRGTPTARTPRAASAASSTQIVKSLVFVCDGAYVLALVPGDRRADERASPRRPARREVRVATAEEVVDATGFEPGAVAPFPARAVTSRDGAHAARTRRSGSAPARPSHMAALPPADLQRLAGARTASISWPRLDSRVEPAAEGERRCRPPRRSG